MIDSTAQNILALLNSLPPTPSVTFRGHVDTSLTQARAIDSWDPILIVLEPALRAARAQHIDLPEGASERFLIPVG